MGMYVRVLLRLQPVALRAIHDGVFLLLYYYYFEVLVLFITILFLVVLVTSQSISTITLAGDCRTYVCVRASVIYIYINRIP